MQLETKVIPVFSSPKSSPATDATRETAQNSVQNPIRIDSSSRSDNLAASIVIGLTGWFVVALFCLVTDYLPGLLIPVTAGAFVGCVSGLVAYALMKEDRSS